jgi:glycogen operon protein
VDYYHVDGFRFDLGVTLGREAGGFDKSSGFFDAIRQDPVLAEKKLISEPWDIGPGGYQLGNHPPGFAEWNDRFRDGARRFWSGDLGQRPELAARLMGSSDIFEHRGRKTWATVNFVASHDGFTLRDTVSYNERHNEANGEDGKDGHGANFSRNWGVEGETADAAVQEIRGRVARGLLATVLFSHGTPMLLGGDEMGRTQKGNNNAYCQNNEISWFDWAAKDEALCKFTEKLIKLRKRHPSLRSEKFLHGTVEVLPGIMDVAWFDETGVVLTPEAWADAAAHMLSLRRAAVNGNHVDITLLMLNASNEDRAFLYPHSELPWEVKLISAEPDFSGHPAKDGTVMVCAHCTVLLAVSAPL